MSRPYLTKPQFAAELEKCLQCKTKPCMEACPVKCSPHDFIAAAKQGDVTQAATLIAKQNPLGEVCGLICPDKFCMRACLRRHIDAPIRIPPVQAEIMRLARENNLLTPIPTATPNGKKIAIVGSGPSAVGATAELLKYGFRVSVFERDEVLGGALNLIPKARLPREIITAEWQRLADNSLVDICLNTEISDYTKLLQQGFAAVIVAIGEQKSRKLGIEGEDFAVDYVEYLRNPSQYAYSGKVAIVGGGAAATDCAITAAEQGSAQVEMLVRRRLSDMRITAHERQQLLEHQTDITTMTRVTKLEKHDDTLTIYTCKTQFNTEGKLVDVPHTEVARGGFVLVVLALGSTRAEDMLETENIFYAGDYATGSSTAVEAIASGKNAAAEVAAKAGLI